LALRGMPSDGFRSPVPAELFRLLCPATYSSARTARKMTSRLSLLLAVTIRQRDFLSKYLLGYEKLSYLGEMDAPGQVRIGTLLDGVPIRGIACR
jgi:hypothetical protein